MNVNLTPQQEEWVQAKVTSGRYHNANEVVEEALKLLEERDHDREGRLVVLRQAIQEGIDSGPSGPLDIEAIKRQAREELEREQSSQQAS